MSLTFYMEGKFVFFNQDTHFTEVFFSGVFKLSGYNK